MLAIFLSFQVINERSINQHEFDLRLSSDTAV